MTFRSALYQGKVRHTRLEPFGHSFEYRVFYGLFDIDELADLDRHLRTFSVGRLNLFGFDPADHGPGDGTPLRPWAEAAMKKAGVDLEGGSIYLLAFPHVLGYVFNPLSVWYCYGAEGGLVGVIHEVRNTFGDRHSYVVPIESQGLRHRFGKEMHVSPFNGMDQSYVFTLNEPGERITVGIDQIDARGRSLRAGMALTRRPLTDRNLIGLFVSHPLLTLKVITAIHWQALLLWLKGANFHRRPDPASHTISVVGAESVIT